MTVDRCFDCLVEIKPTDRRFVVLKTLRPDDEVPWHLSAECVCEDCAGWYAEAVELSEGEA